MPSQNILEKLIAEVKNNSEPSKKRIALNRFLQAVYQHKNYLRMPSYSQLADYEEIRHQAIQDTILVVAQKIDCYQEGKPVLPWLRGIFRNKFYDALKRNRPNKVTVLSLEDFDYFIAEEKQEDYRQNMQNFLKSDPENILKNTTIRGYPHISLQKLLWLIIIEDKTWENVAKELKSNISSLSSFYQRNIQKHKAYFQHHLS